MVHHRSGASLLHENRKHTPINQFKYLIIKQTSPMADIYIYTPKSKPKSISNLYASIQPSLYLIYLDQNGWSITKTKTCHIPSYYNWEEKKYV